MKKIAIYTLASGLHDPERVNILAQEFLGTLHVEYELKGTDFSDYGIHALDVIYICTGGTEGIFKKMLPDLRQRSSRPIYLLASGKSNSLAASMEILSYLRQQNINGEIIHGDEEYVNYRLRLLEQAGEAKQKLYGSRYGIVGKPSDWLIASHVDRAIVKERLGIDLIDISIDELFDNLPTNKSIYAGLEKIIETYQLQGFTLRCFDLIDILNDTGCLPLARLNAAGYVAGCEGDVPAMLSMAIVRSLFGVSGFLANPATINPETGELLFAHCTIPLDMVERYELDTHFESGIGTGIRGFMKEGPVTVFKVSGDLKRHYIAEGRLVMSLALPNMCRTQQVIQLSDRMQAHYFLNDPIGNHHIIMPGHHKDILEELLK
jgi:L-fucose isomerase-like protein